MVSFEFTVNPSARDIVIRACSICMSSKQFDFVFGTCDGIDIRRLLEPFVDVIRHAMTLSIARILVRTETIMMLKNKMQMVRQSRPFSVSDY